jgi:HlyD family secretion protein
MKRIWAIVVILAVLATLTIRAFYASRTPDAPALAAEPATRGSIVSVIAATGTLDAVTTVAVGSQVSGTLQSLNADFNSLVKKGQVLARLEPSLFESAVEQARANLVRAEADVEGSRVALSDADRQLQRAQELSAHQLIAAADLDAAVVAQRSAEAEVKSSAAQVTQARASLNQAEVNLSKTIITSPIDGIVVSRDVDVGQTVAASFQAPTLFIIAADLTRMQLKTSIDEADVGQIKPGEPVSFTVDAYPQEMFTGRVEQVRLDPTVESNVVTYSAIVSAPNPELKLKPGMTATVHVEVTRHDDVVRVPSAAVRFHPSADLLKRLGVSEPEGRNAPDIATLWIQNGESMQPVRVHVGVSDGSFTEVLDPTFAEGTRVVTRVTLPESSSTKSTTTSSPLMPTPPGRPPGR